MANSWRRQARIRRIPATSMSPAAMRKTIAARAAMGRLASGPVSSSRTMSTTALVVSWASWLRPPALSATWVWVGLPLTTKLPEKAAATLAAPRPTRSVSSLNASSYFPAYAREVAALWARMTTNNDTAVPRSAAASCRPSAGSARCGSPRGTGPSTATPRPARPATRLTMIAAITAISRPGILRSTQRAASTITMTPAATAASAPCTCGSARTTSRSSAGVLLPATVTPSMSGSCPAATRIPTPVRNPISTVRDRKFARNPSRASRASSSSPPASRAASPASRTYCGDPAAASPARAAPRMAAVAESAPTTRWRDEPKIAKTAIGSSSVYSPVTTGIPAIFAYPKDTGMLTAARVIPASTSAATSDRRTGSSPPITGTACSRARRERTRDSGTVTSACFPGSSAPGNHLAASNLCSVLEPAGCRSWSSG